MGMRIRIYDADRQSLVSIRIRIRMRMRMRMGMRMGIENADRCSLVSIEWE